MDNLTHSLTGLLLARSGLERLTPRAAWIAFLAANAPDSDAISLLGGTEAYFMYHRWATHAIVFTPIMAMLPVAFVALIFRQRLPWIKAWLLSLVCVASHLLLDFTNPYGIRLFLPFSDAWPALDITHVIDIWIWAILLTGVLWPVLSQLINSEIGAKEGRGRGVSIVALCLLGAYDTGRYFLHRRASETLESRIYQGTAPHRVHAFPTNVNPMRWDGWVETDRAWIKLDVDLAKEFDPAPRETYWKTDATPLIETARRLPVFQLMQNFARTPFWRVTPMANPAGARKVELIDLRFGRAGSPGFTAEALLDANGRLLQSTLHF